MAAVESFRDSQLGVGGDAFAVVRLAWPYRVGGPDPRPDFQKSIKVAMKMVLNPEVMADHPVILQWARQIYMEALSRSEERQ